MEKTELDSALHLLFEPRESLRVLEYVSTRAKAPPNAAVKDLRISLHTWYPAIERLENLGLVMVERAPGGRKTRKISLTAQGHAVLDLMRGLPVLIADTPAALLGELAGRSEALTPQRRGELFCRLVEHAERRGSLSWLKEISEQALAAGRPGEAALAVGIDFYLRGDPSAAHASLQDALRHLGAEPECRSYRRALFFHALALDSLNESRAAYESFTRLRRISLASKDATSEADARLGIGIIKARRGQHSDAVVQFRRALSCARAAGALGKEAKALTNLSLATFFTDPQKGLAYADEALGVATQIGAKVLLVHIHANRALMLAVLDRREESRAELALVRMLAREAGYERGEQALAAWISLTKRISRRRRRGSPIDWMDQVLQILRSPPSRLPGARPESPSGHDPKQSGRPHTGNRIA